MATLTVQERFEAKYEVLPSGCWRWTDVLAGNGYGYLAIGGRAGRKVQAHVVGYELYVGPVPEGKQLDHFVCDHPWCVNPAHVRPTTQRENLLRGDTAASRNAAKTHCLNNHPLAGPGSDVLIRKNGARCCRHCSRARDRGRRCPR